MEYQLPNFSVYPVSSECILVDSDSEQGRLTPRSVGDCFVERLASPSPTPDEKINHFDAAHYIEDVMELDSGAALSGSSIEYSDQSQPRVSDEYVREIPHYYDASKLNYPIKSPLEYTDEEFEHLNHFDFLHSLNFQEPPLLPVYLNSNLLNESNNKNYKQSYSNDVYRYRINDLNLMDKYSSLKPVRPTLKRSGSSNSSGGSSRSSKSVRSLLFNKLKVQEASSNQHNNGSINKHKKPNHVMLNHLITCNMNREGYMTSSCISRYKGKFITQIIYFSTDVELGKNV